MTQRSQRILLYSLLSTICPLIASWILYRCFSSDRLLNEPIHSSIEAAGSLVALILGSLLLAQRRFQSASSHHVWVASALFAMGLLDGFHSILHVSASFFLTRGLATFFGGLLFLLVWLPKKVERSSWADIFPWLVIAISFCIGAYLDLFPENVPQLFSADGTFNWLARTINIVGGLGYLAAAPRFILYRSEEGERQNLLFTCQCLMLGIAGLLFAVSTMWGPIWWLFHFLRFASYIIVLRYVFASYVEMQIGLRSANHEMSKRNLELAATNQELEAFCYSVSHDLRAPLRGIDGFSQALLEDYSSAMDAEAKTYLGFIRNGVQRMGQLIDDLLNLSRYTRSEMKVGPVQLSAIAASVAQRLQQTARDRKGEFFIQSDIVVVGDQGLLEVSLENLLNNAWKFSSQHPLARIEFGQTDREGEAVYFVRDNGVGFDMAYASKLFGAFQRLHAHTEFAGSGIGLATVRRIIGRHGGKIWAESSVGNGATFYFTLPNGL